MQRKIEQLQILEDVHETLTEVLKHVANEPSVGLYFVQQHVHKAVPALLTLKSQLVESIVDAELATADAKDALGSVRTMKECGPTVIEHMIKTLQSASNTIPALRQSRRSSISQLLPRPVRPPGVSSGPLRSSSFLGDWHRNTLKSKGSASSDSLPKDTIVGTLNKQEMPPPGGRSITRQEPAERAASIPDVKRTSDLTTESVRNPEQQDMSSTSNHDKVTDGHLKSDLKTVLPKLLSNTGTDNMDSIQDMRNTDVAMNEKTLAEHKKTALVGNSSHYSDIVYDLALSKTELLCDEATTYLRTDAENQFCDGKMVKNNNFIAGQNILGLGKKMPKVVPEKMDGELQLMHLGQAVKIL